MRLARTLGIASALALCFVSIAFAEAPITFEQAKAQAEAQGKLLLIDFYTDT